MATRNARLAAIHSLFRYAAMHHPDHAATIQQVEGTRRLYVLRHESLEPVRELLSEFWPDALSRLKKAVETDHPRAPKR